MHNKRDLKDYKKQITIDKEEDIFAIQCDDVKVKDKFIGFMYDKEAKLIIKWGIYSLVEEYYNKLGELAAGSQEVNYLHKDYRLFRIEKPDSKEEQLALLYDLLDSTGRAEIFIEKLESY